MSPCRPVHALVSMPPMCHVHAAGVHAAHGHVAHAHSAHVHLADNLQGFVGAAVEVLAQARTFPAELGVGTQLDEVFSERRGGGAGVHGEGGKLRCVLGCSVLEDRRAWLVEQSIDDRALRWGDDYRIHHLFSLVATTVTSDKFSFAPSTAMLKGRVFAVLVK